MKFIEITSEDVRKKTVEEIKKDVLKKLKEMQTQEPKKKQKATFDKPTFESEQG